MTNQQLKAHCEDVIANPQDHSEMVLAMAKALLPCLNAEPGIFEWRFKSEPVSRWLALPIERLQEAKDTFGDMVEYRFWCSAPPVPELMPIELKKGALMISAYTTDPMNAEPVLCLSKEGVIEAIRAAGYEVKS